VGAERYFTARVKLGCCLVACRTVETVVNLTASGGFLTDCDCVVLLKEMLPSGLYIDTYQTDSLHLLGAAKVSAIVFM